MNELVVESVGPLALVEDLGRPGHAAIGVTRSGAADRGALRLANRLLGNDEAAAGVEALLGGLALRADGTVTVCVTGAPVPLWVNETAADAYAPLDLRDGDVLTMGAPSRGLRTYVGVAGGLEVERVLGSASTDPTSGVGPPRLAPGHRLRVGEPTGVVAGLDVAAAVLSPRDEVAVRVVLGPRDDWFEPESLRQLGAAVWTVSSDSDRVGVRLTGPTLIRSRDVELPSEAVVRGAIQVPASGQPLVFLADHPTTGGYPVIAVALDADTDALAQVRPGDRVRFSPTRRPW